MLILTEKPVPRTVRHLVTGEIKVAVKQGKFYKVQDVEGQKWYQVHPTDYQKYYKEIDQWFGAELGVLYRQKKSLLKALAEIDAEIKHMENVREAKRIVEKKADRNEIPY